MADLVSRYLEIITLFLCVLTFLYLIKNRSSLESDILGKKRGDPSQPSEKKLVVQDGSEAEKSFKTILGSMKEKTTAVRGLTQGEVKQKRLSSPDKKKDQTKPQRRNKKKQGNGDSGNNRYGEVIKLANLGLEAKEISTKLNMSLGEVELVLKVNRMRGLQGVA
ncbi:MAG: hypothetical protein DRG25_04775 [Deltaproteobacteria bacterium]|nr:MAG: hypothetical protein DRG25_04775 [Deltaproteobacteria bacterium]